MPSASNTYYFGNVWGTQMVFTEQVTVSDDATFMATSTGFNGGTSSGSSYMNAASQISFGAGFGAGKNTTITALFSNQNTGTNGTTCHLGVGDYQILFTGTATFQNNATISATNEVTNSGTNNGFVGSFSSPQISFANSLSTGTNAAISATNSLTNTGTNTGSLALIDASQITFGGNVSMGSNSAIGATNSGTVSDYQITFNNSIVTGQPTISATNSGTVTLGGDFV